MLDVLHFYFEEDMTFSSEELASSRSKLRERIYSEWFGTDYKFKYVSSTERDKAKANKFDPADYETEDMDEMSEAESAQPFDPLKAPQKAPLTGESVTKFDPNSSDPFGGILDAPMSR